LEGRFGSAGVAKQYERSRTHHCWLYGQGIHIHQYFLIKHHTHLASFAAVNYARFGQGSVFLFSKIAWHDLIDLDPNGSDNIESPGPRGAWALDRSFVLVWGCRPKHGCESSTFTATYLARNSLHPVTTLPQSMDACSELNFPLVICCDPDGGGGLIPTELSENIRRPKSPPASSHVCRQLTHCRVR
jgi:hypothetical protein